MPPRSTGTPPKGSFYPSNDTATYRDLLLFEERLKLNAASLQRRKARYQLFLVQLLLVIAFLVSEVLLPPQSSLLAIPYKMVLQRLLPDIYGPDTQVTVHPYFASGLLFVSVTTLVLFFASGIYSEKIAYANKYVPHANRALRSFNMYLNVRKPPLHSKIYFNPLSFFFARPEPPAPSSRSSTTRSSRSPSPAPRGSSRSRSLSPANTSLPIPSIPPASNPRGELIFSSKIDKSFRDAYERYRATFERKREEREREAAWQKSWLSRWQRKANAVGYGPPQVGKSSMRMPSSPQSSTIGRKGTSRGNTPPVGGRDGRSTSSLRERNNNRSPSPSSESELLPLDTDTDTDEADLLGTKREWRQDRSEIGRDMRTFALERAMVHRGV